MKMIILYDNNVDARPPSDTRVYKQPRRDAEQRSKNAKNNKAI